MKWYHHTAVILGLAFVSAVSAAPSMGEMQRLRHTEGKWSVGVNEFEQISKGFPIPSNSYPNQFLLKKMDQLFDEIVQEVAEAEQRHEEYKMLVHDFNDIDMQLKSILLKKLKQMYDQAVAQNNAHSYVKSWHDQDNTDMGKMIDRFLQNKIHSAMQSHRRKEPTFYDDTASTSDHEYQANIMTDQSKYIPIYRFDGASSDYCYPDWPSSQNDNQCVTTLNPNAPVFYEVDTCNGQTVYTYWLWYGFQQPCIFNQGTHGNDWEHVSVYVNPSNGLASKVVFHQHNGHYTRRRGTYQAEGERPIVYVGKWAHGSYHTDCNGQCSFREFLDYGCFGSVRYCIGGCGYWDDFRNPGPELRNPRLYLLKESQEIDGIVRPDREVCGLATCEGLNFRSLTESGCWQDEP